MSDWHAQTIPHILHALATDLERGLTNDAARARHQRYGDNGFDSLPIPRLSLLLLRQIANIPVLLLAVAAAALWYSQQAVHEAIVIFAILGFQVVWRFALVTKARNQLQTIRKHVNIHVSVIRGGVLTKLFPKDIVPGDLLILNEGDYVPADARVVETDSLGIDESRLFDGAISVQKSAEDALESATVPPEKQRNMVFGGTYVVEGHGRVIVVKTGKNLELQINGRQPSIPSDPCTEAERQMRRFYNYFSFTGLIAATVAVAITWALTRTADVRLEWMQLFLLGLGFAIASVPDGIASMTWSILADSAEKLLKKGVAIQRLDTLEKLNNLNAVCVDEIGTVTQASLSLSHVFVDEQLIEQAAWEQWIADLDEASGDADENTLPVPPPESQVPYGFPLLILAASRCASGRRYRHANSAGEDIYTALKEVANRIGFDLKRYDTELPLIDEIPETPNHPYQGFVFNTEGEKRLEIILGNPGAVLLDCRSVQDQGTTYEISSDQSELIRQVTKHLQSRGAHVFGVAHRIFGAAGFQRDIKRGATFLGLVALSSSIHKESREAVESCMDAGVKVVVSTDLDSRAATELAKEIGITQDRNAIAERFDFDIHGEDYDSVVSRSLVYCKLSAAQTLKITQHLARHGYTLGFLGRSPRDVGAMKAADLSLASASHACHAVQQHAHCLVLKDGFSVIEALLHHAREACDNLRYSMRWLLSCTLAQLFTLVAGLALHRLYGFPMPLTLLQIVWIHLLVNVIPLGFLGRDRIQEQFKYRRLQKIPPFLHTPWRADLLRGLFMSAFAIAGFLVTIGPRSASWAQTQMVAQSTTCTILIFTQLLSNFQRRRYAWESLPQRMAANLPLLSAILVCLGLHTAVIYHEPAANIFGTAPLRLGEWQWVGAFCVLAVLPLNRQKAKKLFANSARIHK
ncbi:MAG: cation transporting ATPase C-terminal domain-containing protein [Candidatus Poribacteria bacterium]|nr:cation transporting ATPase C-terminal domain-containing protein [Candidatus Poribacteria bacterium]MDE0502710.1 cation transporting ATPase C-terminal domain-containing protein [Candidatus Poribacteria bacterium]